MEAGYLGVGARVQPMAHELLDANRSLTVYEASTAQQPGSHTRHPHLAADSASRQLKDAKVSLVRADALIVLGPMEPY